MENILNYLLDNWIAVLSFFVSTCTLIYTWYTNKMNLNISIDEVVVSNNDKYNNLAIVRCTISNRSKNNITISSVETLIDNRKCICVNDSVSLGYIGVEINNKTCKWEETTISLPLRLESYDCIVTSIVFVVSKKSTLPDKLKLQFNTSRGKKNISFTKKR